MSASRSTQIRAKSLKYKQAEPATNSKIRDRAPLAVCPEPQSTVGNTDGESIRLTNELLRVASRNSQIRRPRVRQSRNAHTGSAGIPRGKYRRFTTTIAIHNGMMRRLKRPFAPPTTANALSRDSKLGDSITTQQKAIGRVPPERLNIPTGQKRVSFNRKLHYGRMILKCDTLARRNKPPKERRACERKRIKITPAIRAPTARRN